MGRPKYRSMGCEGDVIDGRPCDWPDCAASTNRSVSFLPAWSFTSLTSTTRENPVRFIGLDVHRDWCDFAIYQDGSVRSCGRVATAPEQLELFAQSLGPGRSRRAGDDRQRAEHRQDHRTARRRGVGRRHAQRPRDDAREGQKRPRRRQDDRQAVGRRDAAGRLKQRLRSARHVLCDARHDALARPAARVWTTRPRTPQQQTCDRRRRAQDRLPDLATAHPPAGYIYERTALTRLSGVS
jgi:hypothetical protein